MATRIGILLAVTMLWLAADAQAQGRGRGNGNASRAQGNGPAFCRSGAGHPVHGWAWCRDKGWDRTRTSRIDRDRRDRDGRIVDRDGRIIVVPDDRDRDRDGDIAIPRRRPGDNDDEDRGRIFGIPIPF